MALQQPPRQNEEPSPWPAIILFLTCAALSTLISLLKLASPWHLLKVLPLFVGMSVLDKRFGAVIAVLGFAAYWVSAFLLGFLIGLMR